MSRGRRRPDRTTRHRRGGEQDHRASRAPGDAGHRHDARGHDAHGHDDHGHDDHGHDDHGHDGHGHDAHGRDDHGHEHRGGLLGVLGGVFSAHNHDHGRSADPALEASAEGMRALKLSLAGLGFTAVFQAVIVAVSGSVALLGDTVHNVADALTAVPLGVAFLVGRRRPNSRYTYGYGRAEDLAGIFIVATIALSAGVTAWEAVQRLIRPQQVHAVGWVALAGVVGFLGNELVALYRIRVGRKIGSAALVADGLHARTDGLTSLAVVVGALGVAAGWPLADPVVGLVISVAILGVLRSAARDVYRRLMDSVDPDLVDRVSAVLDGVPGIEEVEAVRIRWVGHELRAEAEVISDCDLTLAQGHAIAEEGHHRLLHQIPRLARATIHTSPCHHDGRDHHAPTAHHFPAALGEVARRRAADPSRGDGPATDKLRN